MRTRSFLTIVLAVVMVLASITMTSSLEAAGTLVHDESVLVSQNNDDAKISVYPGAAGYEGSPTSGSITGTFGDGTILDYNLVTVVAGLVTTYADGGRGDHI